MIRRWILVAALVAANLPTHAAPTIATTAAGEVIKLLLFTPAKIVVTATGSGATREDATRAAILAAAHQAFGSMIASTQVSEGEQLVRDDIIQHTTGIVNSYDVQYCAPTAGRWQCQIKAVVSAATLRRAAIARGAMVQELDGQAAHAEQVSVLYSIKENRRLVDGMFVDMRSAIDVKLDASKPDPVRSAITVTYTATLNPAYVEALADVLARTQKTGEHIRASSKPRHVTLLHTWVPSDYRLHDNKMVDAVSAALARQLGVDVLVQARGADGTVLAATCDRYRTALFSPTLRAGRNEYPVAVGAPEDPVLYPGRVESRELSLAVSEAVLADVRSISVTFGCSGAQR